MNTTISKYANRYNAGRLLVLVMDIIGLLLLGMTIGSGDTQNYLPQALALITAANFLNLFINIKEYRLGSRLNFHRLSHTH